MIKKFFKALVNGVRNCDCLRCLGIVFLMFGWSPILAELILKIFKVNVSQGEEIAIVICAACVGAVIYAFVWHCVEAMKYQEKHKCDFSEAWIATDDMGVKNDSEF